MEESAKIIFDNGCKLCNQAVRFLKSGTNESGLAFFPAEDQSADALLRQHQIPREITGKTVILLDKNKIYFKSAAILKALQKKGGLWKLSALLFIIPAFVRDAIYDVIARNR